MKRILVDIDLTANSIAALEYGLMLSKLYKAELYVIHVIDNSPSRVSSDTMQVELGNDVGIEENVRIEINRYIREMLQDYCEIIQVVKYGSPEIEIVKFADEEQIDLIILSENKNLEIPRIKNKAFAEKYFSINDVQVIVVTADKGRRTLQAKDLLITGQPAANYGAQAN